MFCGCVGICSMLNNGCGVIIDDAKTISVCQIENNIIAEENIFKIFFEVFFMLI
jgi:hypothetical protein